MNISCHRAISAGECQSLCPSSLNHALLVINPNSTISLQAVISSDVLSVKIASTDSVRAPREVILEAKKFALEYVERLTFPKIPAQVFALTLWSVIFKK